MSNSLWSRLARNFYDYTPDYIQHITDLKTDHDLLNLRVHTRQVKRKRLTKLFFDQVTTEYEGLPRRARRQIARNRMKRDWQSTTSNS